MVAITVDPSNPERLILTAVATLYLDRLLLSALSSEVESAIREQAVSDLKGSKPVRRAIAEAARLRLLAMLGVSPDAPSSVEGPRP